MASPTSPRTLGRPPATSHAAIESAAFELFEQRGFDATTVDDVATAAGIGRRTLFRYYPSKNDILWGRFDTGLASFERHLAEVDDAVATGDALRDAIIAFNRLDEQAVAQHRRRMRLLLGTPTLLAHSELRYAAWREVVARFVARRHGVGVDDVVPQLAGRVALAVALTAYGRWLTDEGLDLETLIRQAASGLDHLTPSA